jgi:Tfp pilus assembly major pilin PilA
MKRQKGMTFIGWVVILALVLSYVYIGIKVVPAYVEFFSVKKILATMAREPGFAP